MDTDTDTEDQIQFSKKDFLKMIFIINAVEDGW